MVLHHVAQGAGGLVKSTTLLHAQFFGYRDLDVGNMFAPPKWLEQGVAKAQGEQVLHSRFAQVMVDPEDLLFAEGAAHCFIDGTVAGQIVAERLFQHDAGLGAVQTSLVQLLADGGKERRSGCHIHHHGIGLARRQRGRQAGIVSRSGQIDPDKFQQGGKARELFFIRAFRQLNLVKTRADQAAVLFGAEVVATNADDASVRWQRAMAKGLKQGGHQFAPGQVASATKQNKIKTHRQPGVGDFRP